MAYMIAKDEMMHSIAMHEIKNVTLSEFMGIIAII